MNKTYMVLDERATYDEERAAVLCCAETLKEAKRDCKEFGFNCCVFEYDFDVKKNKATNGRMVYYYKC